MMLKFKSIPCYLFADYKIYIVIALSILTIFNIFEIGISAAKQVFAAMVVAGVIDGLIVKFRSKKWYFPSGAIISGMIIALLINPADVKNTVIVVLISLALKHLVNWKHRNIFNPAVFAIVISSLFLPIFSSWWGAPSNITFIVGLLLVILIKRWNISLSFLISYAVLISIKQMIAGSFSFSFGLFTGSIAFFAFFMVIEPVTTPKSVRGQLIFGFLVALLAIIVSYIPGMLGNSFFLYLPLMFMNLMLRFFPKLD